MRSLELLPDALFESCLLIPALLAKGLGLYMTLLFEPLNLVLVTLFELSVSFSELLFPLLGRLLELLDLALVSFFESRAFLAEFFSKGTNLAFSLGSHKIGPAFLFELFS